MPFQEVPTNIDFAKQEEEILSFWKKNSIFQKSIDQRPTDKPFSFYDGPPFATGLPHYGHLLANILKDIVPRYWAMKGYHIERRFGWDCHGLPIEYEIDKKLGISGRVAVEKFGIAKYNAECRSIVQRYAKEWEKTVERIGRWVDFKHDYKTMDLNFMESVWWAFKQLWDQGLIYKGYRVMPYSTAVATPLSNFEAGSNYKEVQDPAITIIFKIVNEADTSFLAWTTTPWTLPSNLALAVGPEIDYVKIHSKKAEHNFILADARLKHYFKDEKDYDVIQRYKGSDLVGREYEPLFPYFKDLRDKKAFRILSADFVSTEDGTGVVHMAPAFGEDDFNLCQKNGLPLVMPVDDDGNFTKEVSDYTGRYVKDADKDIIARLKAEHKLFKHDTCTHNYPFCWRSDTPLIYRAVSSWFIRVEALRERLVKNNQETHWVPETLRDGRFGNWLEGARDWNVSRNRFWGNPLPIWENKETGEVICVGSVGELEELSGKKITDLHREHIDSIEFKSKSGHGVFKRVPEVLDCWFESGSMPYAQAHYPFENKQKFEKGFPADFIAEGLDQTRGWFYTLAVLGTVLFDKIPFKHVIVNGMVLAEDGKKMSKRLKNYPDPNEILSNYGADALRLFMMQSPAVRAEEMRFSEAGVKDLVRRVLLKWWNAYSFFVSYAVIDKWKPNKTTNHQPSTTNILDAWILSRLQTLLKTTEDEMARYHLYNVIPALLDFIEDLTNIYIRLNRKRFWGEQKTADKDAAYETLYTVLFTMSEVMAPFAPFLSETMYQNLKMDGHESVHLRDFPVSHSSLINTDLEKSVEIMKRVILMARNVRDQHNIKVKIPLKRLTIIHRNEAHLNRLKVLEAYLKEELNVREVVYQTDEEDFVSLTAKANGAALGRRLGKKFAAINVAITALKHEQIAELEGGEALMIDGETITHNDVIIYRNAKEGHPNVMSDSHITLELDITLAQDQIDEGLAREVVNRIQKLRKTADFKLSDRISVLCQASQALRQAIEKNANYVSEQVLAISLEFSDTPQGEAVEEFDVDGEKLVIAVARK